MKDQIKDRPFRVTSTVDKAAGSWPQGADASSMKVGGLVRAQTSNHTCQIFYVSRPLARSENDALFYMQRREQTNAQVQLSRRVTLAVLNAKVDSKSTP